MSVMTVVVIAACSVLAILVGLKVFVADTRKRDVLGGLMRSTQATARLLRVMILRSVDVDAPLKQELLTALAEEKVLCDDCPLRRSSLCEECGRFASGEGRKPA